MKASQEFAEATAGCVGGVGALSQRESGLEYIIKKKRKEKDGKSWEQLQLSEQAQTTE